MIKETIIQKLINQNHYKTYLELGYQHGGSFRRILCQRKISVDPDPATHPTYKMTSDEYFLKYKLPIDIVLIDAMHHADFVERDICSASKVLTKHGAIVLHDTSPTTALEAKVPRASKIWMGDVYRAFIGFRQAYPDVTAYTHDCDCGVSVILPAGQIFEPGFISGVTFKEFMKNKKELLNFV